MAENNQNPDVKTVQSLLALIKEAQATDTNGDHNLDQKELVAHALERYKAAHPNEADPFAELRNDAELLKSKDATEDKRYAAEMRLKKFLKESDAHQLEAGLLSNNAHLSAILSDESHAAKAEKEAAKRKQQEPVVPSPELYVQMSIANAKVMLGNMMTARGVDKETQEKVQNDMAEVFSNAQEHALKELAAMFERVETKSKANTAQGNNQAYDMVVKSLAPLKESDPVAYEKRLASVRKTMGIKEESNDHETTQQAASPQLADIIKGLRKELGHYQLATAPADPSILNELGKQLTAQTTQRQPEQNPAR